MIGTTDFKKIIASSTRSDLHVRAFAKASQIWCGSHRPKGSGAIQKLIGKRISYPAPTRWNSHFDCVSELLKYDDSAEAESNTLNKLLVVTQTNKFLYSSFTRPELTYLKEYVMVMKPIAGGLDFLQGDQNCFYGQLLPTLLATREKLQNLQRDDSFLMLKGIAKKVSEAFTERFEKFINLDDQLSLLATVSHPSYKLRWTTNPAEKEKARQAFVAEVAQEKQRLEAEQEQLSQQNSSDRQGNTSASNSATPSTSGFLNLNDDEPDDIDEAVRFLGDTQKDFSMLNNYPIVREIFLKANTSLTSSAAIERTFNFAGMVNDKKRASMIPENFETCVVMKGNQSFIKREQNMKMK